MTTDTTSPKKTKAQLDKEERFHNALGTLDGLLEKIARQGLQRMNASSVVELKAMQHTAHNASMIAIERALESLATYVERYIQRDPLFSKGEYITTLNRLWLLLSVTRKRAQNGEDLESMRDILGEARRSYTQSEEPLTLQPLGAHGWVTDTSFVGITVYFASRAEPDVVYQASNAKPTMYFGNDPRKLLKQSVSDTLDLSIQHFAHGAFVFERAKISHDHRLSLHKNLRVHKAANTGSQAYDAFAIRAWTDLIARFRNAHLDPIHGAGSLLAYVQPSGWSTLTTHTKTARATAQITDRTGAPITLEIPLRPENNFLLDNLQVILDPRSKAPKPQALFARFFLSGGTLKAFPITAIYHEPISIVGLPGAFHELHLSLEKPQNRRPSASRSSSNGDASSHYPKTRRRTIIP